MKYLSLLVLLALTACGGGGETPAPKIFNGDGANAVGCTTEVVLGVLPGINVDCGAGPVFIPFGVDGAKGEQGDAGTNGTNGSNGTDGQDGIDGQNGVDGVSCTFEDQPDENRIKIDCSGDIIYVPKAGGATNGGGSLLSETLLLNHNTESSNSNNHITSIYSNNARYVFRRFNSDGFTISEVFKVRDNGDTSPGTLYAFNYFDDEGELHRDGNAATQRPYKNGTSWTNYTASHEEWFQHGVLHRDDGPAQTLVYCVNTIESGCRLQQQVYKLNGIQTRLTDHPSKISYSASDYYQPKSTQYEYRHEYTNSVGDVHRDGDNPAVIIFENDNSVQSKSYYQNSKISRGVGPSYVQYSYSTGAIISRYWDIDGKRYKTFSSGATTIPSEFIDSADAKAQFITAGGTEAGWNATE